MRLKLQSIFSDRVELNAIIGCVSNSIKPYLHKNFETESYIDCHKQSKHKSQLHEIIRIIIHISYHNFRRTVTILFH